MVRKIVVEILEDIKGLLAELKLQNDQASRDALSNLINEEASYINKLVSASKEAASKEVAKIGVGTKVSWVDHTGAWSGTVTEVHYAKVRRTVHNISAANDGPGYQHEITRVGTYADPVLYIAIEGGAGGTALISLSVLQIDELVIQD